MASTAMQRRPRFNPSEYKEDFTDLMKINPQLAADSATKLAKAKRNLDEVVVSSDIATKELVAFLGSTVLMATAGWWSGGIMAKRDALIADWEAEGAESVGASLTETPQPWDHERGVKDPGYWWVIPKLMVFPVVTGLLAVVSASMRKPLQMPSAFERTMTVTAQSTFGLIIAQMAGAWAYKGREKKLAASTDLNSVSATNGEIGATGT